MKLTSLAFLSIALLAACQAAPRRANYTVKNQIDVRVPAGTEELRLWMALPQTDSVQQIAALSIDCPYSSRITTDSEGNRVLFVEARSPKEGTLSIATSFDLTRREDRHDVDAKASRPLDEAEKARFAKELSGNANIVLSQEIRDLSARILGAETNPVIAARSLFDWTLRNIDFWIKAPGDRQGSAVGSSEYCLSTKSGSSTDFHSLYAALARSAGIPTRIMFGSLLNHELDGVDVGQGDHCWIEFYAPELGWIPLDVAEADLFVGDFNLTSANHELVKRATPAGYHGPDPDLVQYYFGNLDERRVLWSSGRDLILEPTTAAGAVNALPRAYVEIDGRVAPENSAWSRKLTYRQLR